MHYGSSWHSDSLVCFHHVTANVNMASECQIVVSVCLSLAATWHAPLCSQYYTFHYFHQLTAVPSFPLAASPFFVLKLCRLTGGSAVGENCKLQVLVAVALLEPQLPWYTRIWYTIHIRALEVRSLCMRHIMPANCCM